VTSCVVSSNPTSLLGHTKTLSQSRLLAFHSSDWFDRIYADVSQASTAWHAIWELSPERGGTCHLDARFGAIAAFPYSTRHDSVPVRIARCGGETCTVFFVVRGGLRRDPRFRSTMGHAGALATSPQTHVNTAVSPERHPPPATPLRTAPHRRRRGYPGGFGGGPSADPAYCRRTSVTTRL